LFAEQRIWRRGLQLRKGRQPVRLPPAQLDHRLPADFAARADPALTEKGRPLKKGAHPGAEPAPLERPWTRTGCGRRPSIYFDLYGEPQSESQDGNSGLL